MCTTVNLTTYFVVNNSGLEVNLNNALQEFGLTDQQSKIYLLLIKHKELRIHEIVKLSGIPRSSVYENLDNLFVLGLIEENIEDSYKKFRAYPITSLGHRLDEEIRELKQKSIKLSKLENLIADEFTEPASNAFHIRNYSGKSGARQLFWNTLKAKGPVDVYSEWGRSKYLGVRFYERFVTQSLNKNIVERVIIAKSDKTFKLVQEHLGSSVSRTKPNSVRVIVDGSIKITGETFIYDNIFAQVYLKNGEIHGFEIENPHFVKSQKSIFRYLWQTASPLSEHL